LAISRLAHNSRRYAVSSYVLLTRYNCGNEEAKQDDTIEAKDQVEGDRVFREKYRFCPTCLPIKAKVRFRLINIEPLPSLWEGIEISACSQLFAGVFPRCRGLAMPAGARKILRIIACLNVSALNTAQRNQRSGKKIGQKTGRIWIK
jgi:hypothetical protein